MNRVGVQLMGQVAIPHTQEDGFVGRAVGAMIRRSVRKSFRRVYIKDDSISTQSPIIFVVNHHGWFDGYLMYHVVSQLRKKSLDWIEEYDSFPLFRFVGGMPYPRNDTAKRVETVRKTIRAMKEEGKSLVLFAEGVLHDPPSVLKFGRSLELLCKKVPEAEIVPVSIRYDLSIHQRPTAKIWLGPNLKGTPEICEQSRQAIENQLTRIEAMSLSQFSVLVEGTPDVNERWSMKGLPERLK